MRCVVALVALGSIACGPPTEAFCGLPSTAPSIDEIAVGDGQALLNGNVFNGDASYKIGPGASLDVGLLNMGLQNDTTGTSVEEVIGRGAFPICVEFGVRDEQTMTAQYLESPSPMSDASHTGALSILATEGDTLVGRFQVDLDGAVFTDGIFRATKR